MGCYTCHKIIVDGKADEAIIEELRHSCEQAEFALKPDGTCAQESKWYDADEHLKAFSLKHPEKVFCLHGEGEEPADIWNTYYKNGKMQHCPAIITFESYDENKLK